MTASFTRNCRTFHSQSELDRIRDDIARSMVGRMVDLLTGANRTARGIVTAVDTATGKPQIVVAGLRYDLRQVLTVTPAAAN